MENALFNEATDIDLLFCLAVGEVVIGEDIGAGEEAKNALCNAKIEGLKFALGCIRDYETKMIDEALLICIARKKFKNILAAKSVKEVQKASKPPQPKYIGGQWVTSEQDVPEEELAIWAVTSPNNKLTSVAADRYLELFRQIYGCSPLEFNKLDAGEQHRIREGIKYRV